MRCSLDSGLDAILAYAGIFALAVITSMGIPGPGDGALVAAGIAAAEGRLDIALVIGIAIIAGVLGCELGYRLGESKGRKLLERPGPLLNWRMSALTKGEALMSKYDKLASFVVPSLICGIKKVPRGTFFLYSTLSRIWWALATTLSAYYLGDGLAHVIRQATNLPVLAIIAVLALTTVVVRWVWTSRTRSRTA